MDAALQALARMPVQTMGDREYVDTRAREWDALFAEERSVAEIVAFLASRVPGLNEGRAQALVMSAYAGYEGRLKQTGAPQVVAAEESDPSDDGYEGWVDTGGEIA